MSNKDVASLERIAPELEPQSIPTPERDVIRFVQSDGTLTELGQSRGVDVGFAQSLYREMVLARRLDVEALALQRQGELNLWLQCAGQEAAQVGSIRALDAADMVFPSYREHAAALSRGVTASELLSPWRGASHAGWDGSARRFHLYSLVLGTQTLHATGFAAGSRLAGTDDIVLTYFGDGAASQGDVNEALNWAAAMKLPVVFFCQNNQWAISTPSSSQMGAPLHQRAAGFGMPAWHVDGNDVLAVHAVTEAAALHVRSGRGPAFIEAQTYRMAGHSSSDDPGRYRGADEVTLWGGRDPISRMAKLLGELGTAEQFFAGLRAESDDFARDIRSACLSIERPRFEELFGNVYAEPHPVMERERAEFCALTSMLDAGV
ncbi:pyruvate dehydrogenase (acetyl-transferring) E1 component subunit alpha [Subtercola boreus]|uniref:2-oxoisovalerate dehydrogenase subunit alpha n=1 Tax=Subtercola boreus TaxID=120213 RepID=A0A3E0VCS1_9MICO|nr:thiamine pyrophosphate-dependent enzyme [Subtercola boreus]RFA07541.1 pyruvate dehydrogenase (acetyl-transferring) E1 component subunit alpha [Subtercola boreus]